MTTLGESIANTANAHEKAEKSREDAIRAQKEANNARAEGIIEVRRQNLLNEVAGKLAYLRLEKAAAAMMDRAPPAHTLIVTLGLNSSYLGNALINLDEKDFANDCSFGEGTDQWWAEVRDLPAGDFSELIAKTNVFCDLEKEAEAQGLNIKLLSAWIDNESGKSVLRPGYYRMSSNNLVLVITPLPIPDAIIDIMKPLYDYPVVEINAVSDPKPPTRSLRSATVRANTRLAGDGPKGTA